MDAAVELQQSRGFISTQLHSASIAVSSEIPSSFTLTIFKYTLNFTVKCATAVHPPSTPPSPTLTATPAAPLRYLEFHLEFWDTCKK